MGFEGYLSCAAAVAPPTAKTSNRMARRFMSVAPALPRSQPG
jgi:hypothetical protein